MANPGVTVAIVLSALSGTILLWVLFYYVHKYINRQCEEFNQFCHFVYFHLTRRCNCRDYKQDYGNENALESGDHRLRGGGRYSNSKSREMGKKRENRFRTRKRRAKGTSQLDTSQSSVGQTKQPAERSPPPALLNRRDQHPRRGQHEGNPPLHFPVMPPVSGQMNTLAMPPVCTVNEMGGLNAMNSLNLPAMNPYAPIPMTAPSMYLPFCGQPQQYEDLSALTLSPEIETEVATDASYTARPQPGPRNLDFIAVVDAYPEYVQDMIADSRARDYVCVSGETDILEETDMNNKNDSIEELPRSYIPQPTPRAGFAVPPIIQHNKWAGMTPIRPSPSKRMNRLPNRVCGTGSEGTNTKPLPHFKRRDDIRRKKLPSSSGVQRPPREDQICADYPEYDRGSANLGDPGFMTTKNYFGPGEEHEERKEDNEIYHKAQQEGVSPRSTPLELLQLEREPEPEPKHDLQEPQTAIQPEAEMDHGCILLPPSLLLNTTSLTEVAQPIPITTASPTALPPTLISSLHHSHLDSYEYQQADQQGSEVPSSHDISSLRESEVLRLDMGGSAVVSDIDGWETEDEQRGAFHGPQ